MTKMRHPWTNGHVEHMHRTIKETTVKRVHHDIPAQLRTHLAGLMIAYNFARRLKILKDLTPDEFTMQIMDIKTTTMHPNPIHYTPGQIA